MTPLPSDPASDPARAPDPALDAWLTAGDPTALDRALAALIQDVAMPVVRRTLGRRLATSAAGASGEAEETVSRVREQLVRSALRMRQPGVAPVRDYAGYVATIARSVWAETLRNKYPARALLSHRLRYLLENRTSQTGFALWTAHDGELFCGFIAWRASTAPDASVESLRRLLVNPRLADGPHGAAASNTLPDTVARTLRWLGGPAPMADVLTIVAERLGIHDQPETLEPEHEGVSSNHDPAPTPEEALRWREYLAWLWNEIGRLPVRQRRAFLLHSTAAHEMEYGAIAGVRQQAALLEIKPESLVEYWNRLPLDDLTIAAMLGVSRQQVINLRKVARATLGAAWRKWLDRKPKVQVSGHNGRFSPSTH